MSESQAEVIDMGHVKHDQAAQMIIQLATAQVRNAKDLGRHAFGMGLPITANPFERLTGHDLLQRAWRDGWMENYRG